MKPKWFKTRGYKHFDSPVGLTYSGRVCDPLFVERYSWSPLIRYTKETKRYYAKEARTRRKLRPIMYASHRDACILSKYSWDLTRALDRFYEAHGLTRNVIAYRKLGMANYDFSAVASEFAKKKAPCIVLCFDITGFFDNLDHAILKDRLKRILGVSELSPDWYRVFRHVTRFDFVEKASLEENSVFASRMASRSRAPIATVKELKQAGVCIHRNPNRYGIPQGTPISSALSNLYLMDLDCRLAALCEGLNALYQRYSDDIIIVCSAGQEAIVTRELRSAISSHKLELKDEKMERVEFDNGSPKAFQYLGFNVSPDGAMVRPSSLARQWRKAKRAIWRTQKVGVEAIAAGKSERIYTKKLRRRFSPVGVRNFSSYVRRSSRAFGSKKMVRQVVRLERMIDAQIRKLNP